MIGRRLSHFRIVEKIGEGGMGVVYKALDEKLGRHVALKVLQPEAVGDESRQLRFMREARAAAAVTHPHIATIHEIDEVDGQIFIAMELVQGPTLDRHLAGRPAAPRDGLRVAIEVAEALARAHACGVIHRDLKPQNIVVGSDGHSKVLDFGLAKLLETAAVADHEQATGMQTVSAEMTREGKVMGTASYMSPEQARGLAVDGRSDVFSYGVLLYEMFTGRLPFQGATVTDTLSAILRDAPVPPSRQNADVPAELERLIAKCLEKDPKDRYQHADEIVVDLRRLRRETDSLPLPRAGDSGPVAAATTGARTAWQRPLVVLGGLAFLAAAVAGALALLRPGGSSTAARATVTALAVLPFQNLKDVEDPQRMGQILQELIITDLSGLESVTVYSSQRLNDIRKQLGGDAKGAGIDSDTATQVARRAGADRMLTGSLSQLDSRWILTSQLIDVADGAVVKSERIDGADLYSMVDDLASRLRRGLGVAASGPSISIKDKTTDSVEAYENYVAGIDELNDNRFEEAVERFEKAVEIDPKFGQAHYKLAVARWWAEDAGATVDADLPAKELEQALAGDVKLSERDRLLAQAFLPLLRKEFVEAVPALQQLVQEFPDEKEAWYGLGEARFHAAGGSADPASIEPFVKALELDPSFHLAYGHVRATLENLRQYDQAIAQVRGLIEKNPAEASWHAELVGWLGRKGDAVAVEGAIDQAFDHLADPAERRRVLTRAGNAFDDPHQAEVYHRRALDLPTEEGRADTLVSLGWLMFGQRRMREAERAFGEALDIDPAHSDALPGTFAVLEAEGRFDEAVLKARALAGQLPGAIRPFAFWIEAAVSKGDEDETARAVEAALGAAPDGNRQRWVWRTAADEYLGIGDVTRAGKYAGMARDALPGEPDPGVTNLLGWIAINNHDLDGAKAHFEGLEESTDPVSALLGLIQVAILQRDFDEAIRAGERLRQHGEWATGGWIGAYLAAGRIGDAERLLDLELKSIPGDVERLNLIEWVASLAVSTGNLALAERLVERAEGLHRADTSGLWVTTAHVRMLAGRYEEAAEVLEGVLAALPHSAEALSRRAHNDLMRENAARAEKTIRDLIARGPATRDFHAALAVILAEQGRYREALPVAETCMEMHKGRDSYGLLAWVLVAGELDLARGIAAAEAGRAIPPPVWETGSLPPYPSPEHALGLARLKQGRFAEAVEILEQAAKLRPYRLLIREHLAQARR